MKNKYLVLLSLILFASCSKDKTTTAYNDLFLSVTYDDVAKHVYYKNGEAKYLDFSVTGPLLLQGNDIYFPAQSGYYKNNDFVTLPDAKTITSVFLKDGIVYAAGTRKNDKAAYWKGEQVFPLQSDSSDYRATPGKIIVTGSQNEVHIGGSVVRGDKRVLLAYWKNQVIDTFTTGLFRDMTVNGSDVHILGGGSYWLNRVKQPLLDAQNKKPEFLSSISIWEGNVYITGGYTTLYWRNGVPCGTLPGDKSHAMGVVIDNGKVVVAVNKGPKQAPAGEYEIQLWKAGIPETWGTGVITGIYKSH